MNILDFLRLNRKVKEEVHSDKNGEILVVSYSNNDENIVVGQLTQSGPFIERLWRKALFPLRNRQIMNILVLGLGGGSVVKPIKQFWPESKITAVEIDYEIVKLGVKYLGLNEKLVDLRISDAFEYVTKENNCYDLIIVDLYIGSQIPLKLKQRSFLNSLKKILKSNSVIIFNHLYFGQHKKRALSFVTSLSKIFSNVYFKKDFPFMATNLLIYCEK